MDKRNSLAVICGLHFKKLLEVFIMSLFNLSKKKEERKAPACACSCGCNCESAVIENTCCSGTDEIRNIKVLGAGCKSCHEQYEYAMTAVKNLGLDIDVEYITDLQKVMTYGVMSMPAIVINDKVVSMGKVLKTADIEKLFGELLK